MGNRTLDARVLELEQALEEQRKIGQKLLDMIPEIYNLKDTVKFLTKQSNRKGGLGNAVDR